MAKGVFGTFALTKGSSMVNDKRRSRFSSVDDTFSYGRPTSKELADAVQSRRDDVANRAKAELGKHHKSLFTAADTDPIIEALGLLHHTYSWPFKPKEVWIYLRSGWYLRQLR
jgi:hypothetical protein